MKFLFVSLLIVHISFPQNIFHQTENRLLFADYLFCQKDYLRAAEEYHLVLQNYFNDSIRFKIALSYSGMEETEKALNLFSILKTNSALMEESRLLYYKVLFQKDYKDFRRQYEKEKYHASLNSLRYFTFLFPGENLPEQKFFTDQFELKDKVYVEDFYLQKKSLPLKDPESAAIFSALLPGLGKIYTKNYGDAVTSFLTVGILTYLTVANFNAGHQFRGYLFGGLSALFYGGNIYGSYASAQIFNARINLDFVNELNSFLKKRNHFLPDYKLCK
jgi:hypothetical protein